MPVDRDDADERSARIDMLLEELRLNREDLTELSKQARARAREAIDETHRVIRRSRAHLDKND